MGPALRFPVSNRLKSWRTWTCTDTYVSARAIFPPNLEERPVETFCTKWMGLVREGRNHSQSSVEGLSIPPNVYPKRAWRLESRAGSAKGQRLTDQGQSGLQSADEERYKKERKEKKMFYSSRVVNRVRRREEIASTERG